MWRAWQERKKKRAEHEQRLGRLFDLTVRAIKERSSDEAKRAIWFSEYYILEYHDLFKFNDARWAFWQTVVIVGGVVATLAGVITVPSSWSTDLGWLSWLRGVPAAIVTVASGILTSFTYKEDAIRHELTGNALWSELVKYQSSAEPYDKGELVDTSLFVNTISRIVKVELQSWSALVGGGRTDGERGSNRQPRRGRRSAARGRR